MDLVNGISLYSMRCAEVRKRLKETMGITEEKKVTQTQTMNATSDLKAKDVEPIFDDKSRSSKNNQNDLQNPSSRHGHILKDCKLNEKF